VGAEPISLVDLRAAVDAWISDFLRDRSAARIEAAELIDEIRRVVSSGGKRLRPAFCYCGYRAAGAAHSDAIVGVASSFELLHTFAIVHDDIMDSATSRRGRPTTVASLGMPTALLVGDLALVLADGAFWASGFEARELAPAFADFTAMREQVIAGQHLDISAHGRDVDESHARAIAVHKSGSYSIEHPLLIGARLGGADDARLARLAAFGRPLGEAFQLRDDLLGIFGDPATTGKPADSDIREGKRTVLFAKALAVLRGDDRAFFQEHWGAPGIADADVDRLRSLVESSGARSGTEQLVEELAADAEKALLDADIDEDARAALGDLVNVAVDRSS
jgi:geranylgeranyl diphosphate synthase type I